MAAAPAPIVPIARRKAAFYINNYTIECGFNQLFSARRAKISA